MLRQVRACPGASTNKWEQGELPGARIKIDLDRRLGRIDRNIYGNFAEHLGCCIYGRIYEQDSRLSDERGFRLYNVIIGDNWQATWQAKRRHP